MRNKYKYKLKLKVIAAVLTLLGVVSYLNLSFSSVVSQKSAGNVYKLWCFRHILKTTKRPSLYYVLCLNCFKLLQTLPGLEETIVFQEKS